jgi:hypothetical protein
MWHSNPWPARAFSRFSALLLGLILALPGKAYRYPLSPEAIREAYFFGRGGDEAHVEKFLAQYKHTFDPPKGRPGVFQIELRTPYQQVASRSWERRTTGYSAQQAQLDYRAQPDLVRVRVFIVLGGAPLRRSEPEPGKGVGTRSPGENFWRDFQFSVTQDHLIQPKKLGGKLTYGPPGRGVSGAEVWLEFDASDLAPRGTRVEVVAPDGRTTVADFPLDQLN